MSESTAAAALRAFLDRVARRVRVVAALRGAATGLAAALLLVFALWLLHGYADTQLRTTAAALALVAAAAGTVIAVLRTRRAGAAARFVEQRVPASRNLIITAAELLDGGRTGSPVRAAVIADAAALAATVDAQRIRPAGRTVLAALLAVLAWAALWTLLGARPAALPELFAGAREAPRILGIDVVVTPPVWIGGDAQRLSDPDRIEALAGSTLRVTVRAAAATVLLETVTGEITLRADAPRTFMADIGIDSDDFLSFEPRDAADAPGARRLFGVTALPDQPPRPRITAPGRDLVLPHADSVLQLEIEAGDDHALASLALRYTRITGFGEQFTFLDGDVPLDIVRRTAGTWTARARWPLEPLALERGDMVVYRAVATDRRPDRAPAESDTYIIEVGDANVAAAGGFATDDDPDRYALSQQMIIVLTERLMARRAALPPEEFAADASVLAAAQRRVRAEFVFMLGGELGDEHEPDDADMMELHEEAHARADLDVLEGRIENQGRAQLVRAIQAMSHAATLLTDAQMDDALRAEQTALIFLQRAFSRSRYILRALNEQERLDLSRRLSGSLALAATDRRPRREEALDSTTAALRSVLALAATLASAASNNVFTRDAGDLARAVLAADPLDSALHEVAAIFADASVIASTGRIDSARERLGDGVLLLGRHVRVLLRPAPIAPPPALRRLDGALTDALRAARAAGGTDRR